MKTIMHQSVSIETAITQLKEGVNIFDVSIDEARGYLTMEKMKGFKFTPGMACDNRDSDGFCKGHPNEEHIQHQLKLTQEKYARNFILCKKLRKNHMLKRIFMLISVVIFVALVVLSFAAILLNPHVAYGATQSVHHDFNLPYDCKITGAPQPIKWIKKGDKSGNKQIKLKWFDSNDAHDIEMEFNGVSTFIPDDGTQVVKKLKKNKKYPVRMRGVSNCGIGEWTAIYKFKS